MDSLNSSFWGLIQTNEDDVDNDIQVETIKRILTSCSERPVSKSTSLKAIQIAQDNPRRRRNGASLRSKSAPSSPTPTIKKRRYFGKDNSYISPRRVHFADMVDGKTTETSVSRDACIPHSAITDELSTKPDENDNLYEENKENMDVLTTVLSNTKSQQSNDGEPTDLDCEKTEENKNLARLRFQWAATKGLPAHVLVVHLRVPFSQKLVTLKWQKEKKVFQSDKHDAVPVGRHGVTMIIAGREVKVEPLDVKFYTFEADVYLLEEEENKLYQDRHILGQLKGNIYPPIDNRENSGKPPKSRTSENTSPQRSSKSEFSNLQQSSSFSTDKTSDSKLPGTGVKDNLNVNERLSSGQSIEKRNGVSDSMPKGFRIPPFNKFSKTSKGKPSKMDEPSNGTEGGKSTSGIRRSKIYEKLVQQQMKYKDGQTRISGSLDNLNRDHYSTAREPVRDTKSKDCEYRPEAGSSKLHSESVDDISSRRDDRYSSYRDNRKKETERARDVRSSSMESRDRDHHHWSSRNGTESQSSKLTREPPHYYNSEQELSRYSDYGSHDSTGRRSMDVSMQRSNDQLVDTNYTAEHRLTKDNLHDGYRSLDHLVDVSWSSTADKHEHDTRSSSRDSGRPQDSSYYSDSQSNDRRDYEKRDNADKYFSDSEVRQSRQVYSEDKGRSGFQREKDRYGPPQIRTPLVTTRTMPLAGKAPDHRMERSHERPKEEHMQDLEDTVLSLKQLLTDRDKDLELLHCEKRKMEVDIRDMREREKTGSTPLGQTGVVLESQKETEKRINDLIREKENMATEIWQLKRDLNKSAKGQLNHQRLDDHLDENDANNMDNFDTTNPRLLQRKIEELELQVKDFQEVNETTAGNLVHTEKELDQLKQDNEVFRKNRNRKIIELEDDNARLKQQLEHGGGGGSDDHYLRHETERLREDLSILRDKNHQLVQDNIKLTEHLKDLESRLDGSSRVGGDNQGERSDLVAECQRYRKEREAALEEVEYLRKELQKSRREGSLNRSLDRDLYQNDVKLRTEENKHTSVSVQSAYRSHTTTLVNGHGEARSKRERKHSGSDLSDSTAVLTSANPGYHGNKDTFKNGTTLTNGKNTQEKDDETNHRYLAAYSAKSISPSHKDTVEDVLDEIPSSVTSKGQYRSRLNTIEDVLDSHDNTSVKNPSLQNNPKTDNNPKLSIPLKSEKDKSHESAHDVYVQDEVSDDGQIQSDDKVSKCNDIEKLPGKPSHNLLLTKTNLEHFHVKTPENAPLNNSQFSMVSVSSSSNRQFPDSQQHKMYSHSSYTATSNPRDSVAPGSHKHRVTESAVSKTKQNFSYQPPSLLNPEDTEDTKLANTSWTLDELSDLEDSVSCVGVNRQAQQQTTVEGHISNTTGQYESTESNFTPGFRERNNSVSSDCTDFLMTDVERLVQQYSGSSVNGGGGATKMTTSSSHGMSQHSISMSNLATQDTLNGALFQPIQQSTKGSGRLSPPPDHNASLRSCSPKPITTQHNKHQRSSPVPDEVSLMVANKRPFCPRNPADLNLDDLVKFSRQGGKISRGYVKYVGHLPGKNDTYLGVELEQEMGKHDGLYEGYRYFRCKPNKGVFVAFSKVVMAWGS